MATIVKIIRSKCQHGQDFCTFRVLDDTITFSKLESQMRCHPDCLMEVAVAQNEGTTLKCGQSFQMSEGPWTVLDDQFTDMYELPVMVILRQFPGTQFLKLNCLPPETRIEESNSSMFTAAPVKNAFDILMSHQQQTAVLPEKKTSSSGVSNGLSRKDDLYNDIVDWMSNRKLSFQNHEEGKYITQSLTNCLWYITNQHTVINDRSRRKSSVLSIPVTFDAFEGYNEYRRKKLKSQPLESSQLNSFAQSLFQLCTRPKMRTSPAWEECYNDLKALGECLMTYSNYLVKQKEQNGNIQKLDHPARPLVDNTSVYTVEKCVGNVKLKYNLIDNANCLADFNEPVIFDEMKHVNMPFEYPMQRLRFFEGMHLSYTVDVVKYCPNGGVVTTWCLFKVPDSRTEAQKASQAVSNMLKIRDKLPEYHTRAMKQELKRKVQNVAHIQPALLETIYQDLCLDASLASHPVTQQRMHIVFMGETGLLPDKRKLNPGRPTATYDTFLPS